MFRLTPRRLAVGLLVASLAAGITLACSSPSTPAGPTVEAGACPNDLPQSCPSPPPSWATQVQPIIDGRCFPCHGDGGIGEAFGNYTTYQGVAQKRTSALQQVFTCVMPPGDASPPATPLSPDERQTLLGWLGPCGAPNN